MLPIQALPQVLIIIAVVFVVGVWLMVAVMIPHRREQKERQERDAPVPLCQVCGEPAYVRSAHGGPSCEAWGRLRMTP